jgi:hypothetical protein
VPLPDAVLHADAHLELGEIRSHAECHGLDEDGECEDAHLQQQRPAIVLRALATAGDEDEPGADADRDGL